MAHKRSPASNSINPATGLPWRIRAPRETRIVSSSMQQSGQRVAKRSVPQICLRGAWLERIGFGRGTRCLVLVEPGQILLASITSP
jgi:hypothetical protein